jgi:CRP-like cAMP-binding protein
MERLAGESLPEWESTQSNLRPSTLRAGQYLFHAGTAVPYVCFVRQGAIKMVYETEDGHEWIKGFAEPGTVFTSLSSLQTAGVASFSTIALIDTDIETLTYETIVNLAKKHLGWQRALSRAFEIYGVRKELRERDLLLLSAEQRYLKFMTEQSSLAKLLSQKDIASYIRITPVALSRIKSRIKNS